MNAGPRFREKQSTEWMDHAACAGSGIEFYLDAPSTRKAASDIPQSWATYREGVRRAKAICQTCPVRLPCLAYALAMEQRWSSNRFGYGIWGGLTPWERARMTT